MHENEECESFIRTVLTTALDDVISDPDIQIALDQVSKEPLVYFDQMKKASSKQETIGKPGLKKLVESSEFVKNMETVLEECLFNLMQEIEFHEFELTESVPFAITESSE